MFSDVRRYIISFIIISVFAFTITSCRKEEGLQNRHTKVSGKITDYDSGAPVSDATIRIMKVDNHSTPTIYDAITYTHTNSNGEYSIKFHAFAEDYINYEIEVSKEPEGYNEIVSYLLKKGHSNTLNHAVIGKAYLKVHIKNVAPFDENDVIIFDKSYYGMYVDTALIFYRYGTGNKRLSWIIKKNGIPTSYDEYIYCTSLTITDYSINY